jgi:hypothetical protein
VKLLEKRITGLPTSLVAPQRYIVSVERIRELVSRQSAVFTNTSVLLILLYQLILLVIPHLFISLMYIHLGLLRCGACSVAVSGTQTGYCRFLGDLFKRISCKPNIPWDKSLNLDVRILSRRISWQIGQMNDSWLWCLMSCCVWNPSLETPTVSCKLMWYFTIR